jgi:hypothetical protein
VSSSRKVAALVSDYFHIRNKNFLFVFIFGFIKLSSTKNHVKIFELEVDEEDEEEEMTEENNQEQALNVENIESDNSAMNNADSKAADINPSVHLSRTKSMKY